MFKLSLKCKDKYIDIGDRVSINTQLNEEPIVGTIAGIFRSVWEPHNICINLKELPPHVSIDISEILSIICVDKGN
ncbi:MAG: hypothetical protein M0P69_11915 [Bacteroidales bacterium]|jgi:hypothetical protein|nr:hypothetical protein [Bacteroidales bacterium]